MVADSQTREQVSVHQAQKTLLKERLQKEGRLSFLQFMQQALYHPRLGYYSAQDRQFGIEGDFITAPEMTPLFGYTLANYIAKVFQTLDHPVLFEFGAGSGKLMISLLKALEEKGALPETYYVLEVSGALKSRQQDALGRELPHLKDKVVFLDTLPSEPINGVIVANEILDAMPCGRFSLTEDGLFDVGLILDEHGEMSETLMAPCEDLQALMPVLSEQQPPYNSEYHPLVEPWIKSLSTLLNQGEVLLFDYGFLQDEYYHPARHMGTLMCHHRHKSHPNPYQNIGEQDITSHVNFCRVGESAEEAGFTVLDFLTQADFLLDNGLLNHLNGMSPQSTEYYRHSQAIKKLTHPEEMGELFKVMILGKSNNEQ